MSFTVQSSGNSRNYSNTQNVVTFCQNRLNSVKANEIIKGNNGLQDLAQVEALLSTSSYIPVLTAVWSERNRDLRLNWLREKASALHAPLLYELALAEFKAQPTLDVLKETSMPLLKAASLRAQQDAACVDDPSLADAPMVMLLTYARALSNLTQTHLGSEVSELVKDSPECTAATKVKLAEVAKQTLTSPMPNPKWIALHGMNVFTGSLKFHPESEWSTRREKISERYLAP